MNIIKGILWGLSIAALIWILMIATYISIDRTVREREIKPVINEALLQKIAFVESSNNPKAVSKKGAVGLYQIRYAVWGATLKKEGIIKGRQCLFNPSVNRTAALYILHHYYQKTNGDIKGTLAKYSGGARGYAEKILGAE